MLKKKFRNTFERYLGFVDLVCSKTTFINIYSIKEEQKKIGLIRILFGLMLLVRYYQIVDSLIVLGSRNSSINQSVLLGVASIFIIFGFLTPVALFALTFAMTLVDIKIETSTLGVYVASMLGIVLLLSNSGEYFSVDRLILKSNMKLKKIWRALYTPFAVQSKEDIARAYFLGFVMYALVSFTAMVFHLNDSSWIHGLTLKALLTNSYLCNFYNLFRSFDAHYPLLFYFFSICGCITQTIYQIGMIPFVFSRLGTFFVFIWGVIFFSISLLFINLGILPHIEILLWIAIFIRMRPKSNPLTFFYDDNCNLCKRSVKFLEIINFNQIYRFTKLSEAKNELQRLNIDYYKAQEEIYAYQGKQVFSGFDVYFKAFRLNILTWVLVPLMFILKLSKLGPKFYCFIANKRKNFLRNCSIEHSKKDQAIQFHTNNGTKSFIFIIYTIMIIAFLGVYMPFYNVKTIFKIKTKGFEKALRCFGLESPNVFNYADLCIGDAWVEIFIDEGGSWVRIPFIGSEGERLNYQSSNKLLLSNHNSDLLYFGTTSPFRRKLGKRYGISLDEAINFISSGEGRGNVFRRISYDYKYKKLKGVRRYKVEFYTKTNFIDEFKNVASEKYKKTLNGTWNYIYDGRTVEKEE